MTVPRTTLALAVVGVALFAGPADGTAARGSAVAPSPAKQFADNVPWSPDSSMLRFEREHSFGQTSWVPASELRSFAP